MASLWDSGRCLIASLWGQSLLLRPVSHVSVSCQLPKRRRTAPCPSRHQRVPPDRCFDGICRCRDVKGTAGMKKSSAEVAGPRDRDEQREESGAAGPGRAARRAGPRDLDEPREESGAAGPGQAARRERGRGTWTSRKKRAGRDEPREESGRRPYLQDSFSFRMWSRHKGLQAENGQFLLEGEPLRILGGSMHYFRVPREYWKDRMMKMKACGLNTLTTYVSWNLHEPQRGKFDFSGNLDLRSYLDTAAEVGLWVILRPGPYICSEWDLGGLPSWLLQDKDMQLRTTYKGFAEATEAYFDQLLPRVVRHQYTRGGPIIAVQVENEYGSYAKDANYMEFIKTALLRRGIIETLLTSDNKDGISSGSMEGVLATINFQKMEPILFTYLESMQGNKPVMVMEYWTGWFDYWGGDHHVFDVDQMVSTVSDVLTKGASINLYMFHGGTNFGFMNGALHFHEYRADVTSYDYDAPLTEAGDYTSKYFKLRELFSKQYTMPLPPAPALITKSTYGAVTLKRSLSLWDSLQLIGEPYKSELPVNMENLPVNNGNGQSYGYTLYETVIYGGGKFQTRGNVRDRAQVFVSGQSVGFVDYKNTELDIAEVPGYRKLRILVENRGRVNYGVRINDQRKGLVGDVFLRDVPLRNYKIYSLDMNSTFIRSLDNIQWSDVSEEKTGPVFCQGALQVTYSPGDTFLSMKGWKKGVVFVNGKNLGRYWDIGPQETLYLPGSWLWLGINTITIFEEQEVGSSLYSVDSPHLGRTQYVD